MLPYSLLQFLFTLLRGNVRNWGICQKTYSFNQPMIKYIWSYKKNLPCNFLRILSSINEYSNLFICLFFIHIAWNSAQSNQFTQWMTHIASMSMNCQFNTHRINLSIHLNRLIWKMSRDLPCAMVFLLSVVPPNSSFKSIECELQPLVVFENKIVS